VNKYINHEKAYLSVCSSYHDSNLARCYLNLREQRNELLEALELLIDDLALRAKLKGDDCLDVSDGILIKAQEAIAKAKGEAND
jgi:hypothetical protein